MANRRSLPKNVSVAHDLEGGRLHAPAAGRNAQAILQVLRQYAPASGSALEIASGTGQHMAGYAAALPGLTWQPTEIDAKRRHSIDAWAAQANVPNLRPALHLDATLPGWGLQHSGQDLIVLVNLIHLISAPETKVIFDEAAQSLNQGGRFAFYGPFLKGGKATSEGDQTFHASLRAKDPEIGYKDVAEIKSWLQGAGFSLIEMAKMPANNLMFIAERPKEAN